MLIGVIMLNASHTEFFNIIVGKIFKLGSWSKFTNWISTSQPICSVSWKKFPNWFPIVGYFIQFYIYVGQILQTGSKHCPVCVCMSAYVRDVQSTGLY